VAATAETWRTSGWQRPADDRASSDGEQLAVIRVPLSSSILIGQCSAALQDSIHKRMRED